MHFSNSFLPTANSVGVSSMLAYYSIVFAAYAFLGGFLFAWFSKDSVVPEHRVSRYYTAIISIVAGISYLLIGHFYHEMLNQLSRTPEEQKQDLINTSYNAIGQLRYIDWGITTPLLLLKTVSVLRVKASREKAAIFWLLFGDLFMIITGYIGEQQLDAAGNIIASAKLIWGAVSTIGYLVIPVVLFYLKKKYFISAQPEEQRAFKWLALSTVTTWGVYPIGYILSTIKGVNTNYIHIAFSVFDVINKVGAGAVVYLAGKSLLDKQVPETAVAQVHSLN